MLQTYPNRSDYSRPQPIDYWTHFHMAVFTAIRSEQNSTKRSKSFDGVDYAGVEVLACAILGLSRVQNDIVNQSNRHLIVP